MQQLVNVLNTKCTTQEWSHRRSWSTGLLCESRIKYSHGVVAQRNRRGDHPYFVRVIYTGVGMHKWLLVRLAMSRAHASQSTASLLQSYVRSRATVWLKTDHELSNDGGGIVCIHI
jgi:hypothetical protein